MIVQAKAKRLGMSLLGQAFFSAQLMQRFHPRSIESVALVTQDDDVLKPLFEQYPGMRVIVCPHGLSAGLDARSVQTDQIGPHQSHDPL